MDIYVRKREKDAQYPKRRIFFHSPSLIITIKGVSTRVSGLLPRFRLEIAPKKALIRPSSFRVLKNFLNLAAASRRIDSKGNPFSVFRIPPECSKRLRYASFIVVDVNLVKALLDFFRQREENSWEDANDAITLDLENRDSSFFLNVVNRN